MKLFYDDILIGKIVTNHGMTIDEALDILDVDLNRFAEENIWFVELMAIILR